MADNKILMQQTSEMLNRIIESRRIQHNEDDRKFLIASIGKDLAHILYPLLVQIANNARLTKEEIKEIISQIKIDSPKIDISPAHVIVPEIKSPSITIPEIKIPEIKIPEIKVPRPSVTVQIPPIKIPESHIQMPDYMNVKMQGVDFKNPLPVILYDTEGKPFMITQTGGGSMPRIMEIKAPSITNIGNVSMTSADTEYSYNLPDNTRGFRMKVRSQNAQFKLAFISGQSNTTFITVNQGGSYGEFGVKFNDRTLYFQSPTASQTMEIISYQW